MTNTHGAGDVEGDLYNLETYALASVLGCAALCVAAVAVACGVWALVAWTMCGGEG